MVYKKKGNMKTKNNVIILSKKKIIGLHINYYTNNNNKQMVS